MQLKKMIGRNILVQTQAAEEVVNGLILPTNISKKDNEVGVVKMLNAKKVKGIEVGDTIIYGRYGVKEVLDGEHGLKIMTDDNVWAVLS